MPSTARKPMAPAGGLAVLALALLGGLQACSGGNQPDEEIRLVVYSSRAEHLIKPLFDAYTERTGVGIDFITGEEQPLIQRLLAEGESTTADLLITVDAGNLWNAASEGVLRPVSSPSLEASIPAHLRDPQGRWFGLSVRARTLVYAPSRTGPAELSTYEALAEPQWRERLCLRTSRKVYNQSLVAMLIAEHGEARAEEIVRGWVGNLATDVFPNDTQVIEAVAAGQCDVGIVNSYYFGRLQAQRPELAAALFWPNQEGTGVHVNVSGAGVTRHAPAPEAAVAFLEWLAQPEAQAMFAGLNYEYPVATGVALDPLVAGWGEFRQNLINVSQAGELQADAVRLMTRAGYR